MSSLRTCLSLFCLLACAAGSEDLCSNSFCKCPEAAKRVVCECESQLQKINVFEGSLPRQTESLSISHCGELTIYSDGFRANRALQSLELQHLNMLDLRNEFYSRREIPHAEMKNLSLASIGEFRIRKGTFRNFPKSNYVLLQEVGIQIVPSGSLEILTDNFVFNNNNIGVLKKSSLYSDAMNLTIAHNRIELIESGAFDASVRFFNFIENTVDKVMNNGISVAFQEGTIANNSFSNQEGSPFQDVGPDPSCTADPESDYDEEDAIIYNIVANPSLLFSANVFLNFTEELLNFPGANNVPLGSLTLEGNVVKCDCEALLSLGLLADFDHHPGAKSYSSLSRGDLLFRKEFYDTGRCIMGDSMERISLKKFMRDHIDPKSLTCSDGAKSAELISKDDHEKEAKELSVPTRLPDINTPPSSSQTTISSTALVFLLHIIYYHF